MSESRQASEFREENTRRHQEPDDEPVLPKVTRADRAVGWGDDPADAPRDAEWYRRERPPHHE